MHTDDLKAYIVARGENVAEVDDTLVLSALELSYSAALNRLEGVDPLPMDFTIAAYGVYSRIKFGGGMAMQGFEVSQGGQTFKAENDIPYNSRQIFKLYQPKRAF